MTRLLDQGGRMTPFPAGNYCTGALRTLGHPQWWPPPCQYLAPSSGRHLCNLGPTQFTHRDLIDTCLVGGHSSAKETTILCLKPSSISNLHASRQNFPAFASSAFRCQCVLSQLYNSIYKSIPRKYERRGDGPHVVGGNAVDCSWVD